MRCLTKMHPSLLPHSTQPQPSIATTDEPAMSEAARRVVIIALDEHPVEDEPHEADAFTVCHRSHDD
ncbi:hypothetical protein BH24ACT5_BH24ACT5_04680 [soil metagenome]